MIIERKVRFGQGRGGRKKARAGSGGTETPTGRVPRVAKLMALAIRFDQLIRDGVVADQAELARIGHISRARSSQILNLLYLSPCLQEQVLFLPEVARGRDQVTERDLRPLTATTDWRNQMLLWRKLTDPCRT